MKIIDKNKIKEAANNYVVSNFLEECTMKQYIIDSFETGFELCEQVFKEKLRWIPIEEKEPPTDLILMKLSNGEIRLGHFLSKMSTSSGIFVNVTHFRNLFL